uniref:Uncharacterized protein n=1 Tax=Romanomermis culicivorax TaxID=13658 RepID=A0A915HG34_ROMCU
MKKYTGTGYGQFAAKGNTVSAVFVSCTDGPIAEALVPLVDAASVDAVIAALTLGGVGGTGGGAGGGGNGVATCWMVDFGVALSTLDDGGGATGGASIALRFSNSTGTAFLAGETGTHSCNITSSLEKNKRNITDSLVRCCCPDDTGNVIRNFPSSNVLSAGVFAGI